MRGLIRATLAAITVMGAGLATAAPLPADAIAAALGAKLTVQGDVLRAVWPREDVKVTVDRTPLAASVLASWAAFTAAGSGALLTGEIVLFADELDAAVDAALAGDLRISAISNRFAFDQPRVFLLDVIATGEAPALAARLRSVLDAARKVRVARPLPAWGFARSPPAAGTPDEKLVARIMGLPARNVDGAVTVEVGRGARMGGTTLGAAMGLSTRAAFQGSNPLAVVSGEFVLTAAETPAVMATLRRGGIHVVSLHGRWPAVEPDYRYLGFWGEGAAAHLAGTLRKALEAQQASRVP